MKKIILGSILSLSLSSVQAVEFLDLDLRNTKTEEMNNAIVKAGGSFHKKEGLTNVYLLNNSKIPYAHWAKTYSNLQGELVGVELAMPYDSESYLNLRKVLGEKYGYPKIKGKFGTSKLTDKYFSGEAVWNFNDNTSLTFDKHHIFSGEDYNSRRTDVTMFYRVNDKAEALKAELKKQHYESEKDKLNSTF